MSGSAGKRTVGHERVEQMLAAYGADPRAWPDDEREQALALVAQDPALQQRMDQERELDGLLACAPAVDPSRDLPGRIIEAAPRASLGWMDRLDAWASGLWPLGRNWQPVGALVAAAVLGVATGFLLPQNDADAGGTAAESVDVLVEYASLGDSL